MSLNFDEFQFCWWILMNSSLVLEFLMKTTFIFDLFLYNPVLSLNFYASHYCSKNFHEFHCHHWIVMISTLLLKFWRTPVSTLNFDEFHFHAWILWIHFCCEKDQFQLDIKILKNLLCFCVLMNSTLVIHNFLFVPLSLLNFDKFYFCPWILMNSTFVLKFW